MRGAAAEHDPEYRGAANDARLAGAVVNPVNFLKIAWLAIGVAIIPQRAASVMNGPIQNGFDASIQPGDLG